MTWHALICVVPVGGVPVAGKVLQVVTDTDHRGAQVFGVELGVDLRRRGWDVRTVALAPGAQSESLDLPCLGHRPLHPRTLAGLRAAAVGAGVVVAHGSTTLPASAIALAGSGVPFVYRNIGDPLYWASTPARRLRVQLALRAARAVVALWTGAAQVLAGRLGVPRQRIRTIPNAVPADRFRPATDHERAAARRSYQLHPDAPTLLFLGALAPEKDVRVVVDALSELAPAQLLVVGDGPEREALGRQAAEVAPGRVTIAGATREPGRALAAADVLVLPSRSEGMPAVLVEAGLAGLPCVATDVGAVREIVDHGRTGEVVAVGDPQALADGVRTALARRDDYGAAARRRCLERFTIDVVGAAWSELLADVVGDEPAGRGQSLRHRP